MTKVLYAIVVLAVLSGGIYAWFYFSENKSPLSIPSQLSSIPPSSPPSSKTGDFPKEPTIKIGTDKGIVEVKNFYNTIVGAEDKLMILADDGDSQISYDRSTSIFYILLRSGAAPRTKTESGLLNILGINRDDACRLDVFVSDPNQPDVTGLSFCPNKVK